MMDYTSRGFQQCPLLWFVWKASAGMSLCDWMMARSDIWIQDECQVNVLLLSARDHNSFSSDRGANETWKPFPSLFSALISRSLARILSITIAHLFLFCFSPRVPIQSIFISPSVPFKAAFISTRSLNLLHPSRSFHQLSDNLCLTSSTCLSSFSLFFILTPWLLPRQTCSSCVGIVCFLLNTSVHSLSLHSQQCPRRTN